MISYHKVLPFLGVAASMLQYADAECKTYYYQKGSSTEKYVAYSYNHDDTSCGSRKDRQALSDGEWVYVKADKDHESTIQVEWRYVYDTGLGYTTDDYTWFYLCDGITQASQCSGTDAYKSTCWKHYVFYPPGTKDDNDFPKVCVADTDSDGNLVYDNNGEPKGDCSGCSFQNNNDYN